MSVIVVVSGRNDNHENARKLCSGIAHGDFWTTWSAAQRVELPGAPDGAGTFKIEASVKMLMYVTTLARQMTKQGWQLYDQRSRPPF